MPDQDEPAEMAVTGGEAMPKNTSPEWRGGRPSPVLDVAFWSLMIGSAFVSIALLADLAIRQA